ncbi:MAG: hypothetical protein WCG29_12305 [Desulfomonile sp.]
MADQDKIPASTTPDSLCSVHRFPLPERKQGEDNAYVNALTRRPYP